jgi:hypothetical protein
MNPFILCTQEYCFKKIISILLTTFFLNITLTFADEPAKAALPNPLSEKAERIKQLQHLSLEDLQKVPVISDKYKQNQSIKQTAQTPNCSPKNQAENCK